MTNSEIAKSSLISQPGSSSHNDQDDLFTLATSSVSLAGIPSSSLAQSAPVSPPKVLPLPVPSSISAILETGLAPTSYIEAESAQEEEEEDASSLGGILPATLVLKVPAPTPEVRSGWSSATAEPDPMHHAVVVQINNFNELESSPNHVELPSPSSPSKTKINSDVERSKRSCDNISLIAQQNLSNIQAVKQNEGLSEKVQPESEDCASSRVPSETARRQITRVNDITAAAEEEEEEEVEVRYTTLQQLRSKFESTRETEAHTGASQIVEDKNNVLATRTSHLEYCDGEEGEDPAALKIRSCEAEVDRLDRSNKEPGQLRRMGPTYQEIQEFQAGPRHACVVLTKPGERPPNKESLTLSDGQSQPSHFTSDDNEENAGKLSDIEGNIVISQQANSEVETDDLDNNPVSDEIQDVNQGEEAGRWSAELRIINTNEGEESGAASSDSSLSSSDCENQVSLSLPSYISTTSSTSTSSYLARLDLHPEHCLQLSSLPEMFVDEEQGATLSDVSPISDCDLTSLPPDNKLASSEVEERGNVSEETPQISDNKTEHYPDQDLHQPVNFYLRRSASPPIRNIENISTPNTLHSTQYSHTTLFLSRVQTEIISWVFTK